MQRIRITLNARKHRVSKHRIQDDDSLYYEGRDTAGRLTEIVAVEADNGDLIITHAMPKEWTR